MPDVDTRFLAATGRRPPQIPHYEHWSCPDAETYLSGIDYYDHPRQCRLALRRLYPELNLPLPATDDPKPRPSLGGDGASSNRDARTVRWGDGESWGWEHGEAHFKTAEQVFAFSPLAHADFRDMPGVVMNYDFRDAEVVYRKFLADFCPDGQIPPKESFSVGGFYNTMFMWPLLTFGWELFLECCLDERFERIMDEFAQINRRVFAALARLPVHFMICHDDIVTAQGPVCPPRWMRKYIFPCYEEFWATLKAAGKKVIFMCDGRLDAFVDDVVACGADGIITEPYTDFRAMARRHPQLVIAGEGDNRVLMENDPAAIRRMVESMVETARMAGGYFMCIGNHIPWNIPPQAVKTYIELSRMLARYD